MRIDVLTLFPEALQPYLTASVLGRAQAAGLLQIRLHQLRDFSTDPHRKVDDRPFGGGPGMILMCQPIFDAVTAIEALDPQPALRILLTPQGRTFKQADAARLAGCERLLLICGHYEGFDERIIDLLQPVEISLGDFVMSGGEPAALAVIDAVARLVPGTLGNEAGTADESFQGERLEYPQYTRPRDYRGLHVPDVLVSGNHAQIEAWRRAQSEQRTRRRRPDLIQDHAAAGVFYACGTAGRCRPFQTNQPAVASRSAEKTTGGASAFRRCDGLVVPARGRCSPNSAPRASRAQLAPPPKTCLEREASGATSTL